MEEKKEDIQLKSEEFQEILEDIPGWIVRWGITVIAVFLIVLFIGSAYFKYPDTVQTGMVLTSTYPPVEIYTQSQGKIEKLYIHNNQRVRQGDILLTLASPVIVDNISFLSSYLQDLRKNFTYSELPPIDLQLGDLQTNYLAFYNLLRNYRLNSSSTEKENLQLAISQLQNDISLWEEKYLIKSPVDGEVVYKDRWVENQRLYQGTQVGTIIPNNRGELYGKAFVPAFYLGKVGVGQSVNIYFDGFPTNDYGVVKGIINYISPLPVEGNYLIEVELTNNLETSYNKTIPYTPLMNAKIDIITQDYSIMDRFLSLVKRF